MSLIKLLKFIPFHVYMSLSITSLFLLPINFDINSWSDDIDSKLFLTMNILSLTLFISICVSVYLFLINSFPELIENFGNIIIICHLILNLIFYISFIQIFPISLNNFMGFLLSVPLYSLTFILFYLVILINKGDFDNSNSNSNSDSDSDSDSNSNSNSC